MDTRQAQGRREDDVQEPSPAARVEGWRLEQLIHAGYPVRIAERLAAAGVDLHTAVGMLERGCKPAVAALILL